MNYYLANTTVVVPVRVPWTTAIEAIGRLFPGRRAIGANASRS
jgi:hypothetical protein